MFQLKNKYIFYTPRHTRIKKVQLPETETSSRAWEQVPSLGIKAGVGQCASSVDPNTWWEGRNKELEFQHNFNLTDTLFFLVLQYIPSTQTGAWCLTGSQYIRLEWLTGINNSFLEWLKWIQSVNFGLKIFSWSGLLAVGKEERDKVWWEREKLLETVDIVSVSRKGEWHGRVKHVGGLPAWDIEKQSRA